eukprot:m.494637 g.494637  ORF g.494637 m.494637 type:complete len:516 (+) comp41349_c0_seq1:133-1680(+)
MGVGDGVRGHAEGGASIAVVGGEGQGWGDSVSLEDVSVGGVKGNDGSDADEYSDGHDEEASSLLDRLDARRLAEAEKALVASPHNEQPRGHTSAAAAIAFLVPSIYVPSFFFGLGDGTTLALVPLFARSLGVGDTLTGLSSAAAPMGKFIGDIPAGMVYARLGHKHTMMCGLAGYCLAALLTFSARSFFLLFLSQLVAGCCQAMFTVSRSSFIRNEVKGNHRGRAVSLLGGVNRVTRAVGPVLGGAISHAYGVSTPFLLQATLAALGAVSIGVSVKHVAGTVSAGGKRAINGSLFAVFRNHARVFMTAGFFAFAISYCRRTRNMVIPVKGDELNLSHYQIGSALSYGYVLDSSLFAVVGWAMDKYGRKMTAVPASLCLSLGLLLVALSGNGVGLIVASVMCGLGNGLSSGINMTLGTDLAPSGQEAGTFLGAWHLLCDAGASIGPVVTGLVAQLSGDLDVGILFAAFVGGFASLWLAVMVKETLRKPQPAPATPATAATAAVAGGQSLAVAQTPG